MTIKTHIKKVVDEFHVMTRACRIVKELSPKNLEFSVIKSVLEATVPFIAIYISALIIDELVGEKNLNVLLLYVLISVGGTALFTVINLLLTKKINVLNTMFVPNVKNYLNNKRYSMDYAMQEDPKYTELHAKIVEIMFITGGGMAAVIRLVCDIVKNLLSLIIALVILFVSSLDTMNAGFSGTSILFLLLTLAVIVSSVVFSAINSKKVSEKEYNLAQNSSTNKYLDYYHYHYMEDDQAGKDIHIFNQRKLIIDEVISKGRLPWMNVLNGRYSLYQKYFGMNVLISTLVGGYAYIYVGLRALAGYISLGDVTKSYASITIIISTINQLFVALSQVKSNNNYLRSFFEFIDAPSKQHTGKQIPEKNNENWVVAFHNVSFRYPNSEEYAVKNVSMKLSSNRRIAVVGMNGSGKTTMIKLLCGLYQPDEGYITLNGKDIREYDHEEYLKLFSLVFQDFKLLALPIGENIATSREYDEEKAWQSIKVAGIDVSVRKLPLKLKQHIYKYVDGDGVDLSGGEEQKLAIARAYYKDSPFIILDEPTASLDPVAEFDIYTRFNELIDKKAAIYISHRLSSCKFCDTINVFDNGKIIQTGSHEMLLQDIGGKYYQLWNAQAQYYR
ncbi:ABC transporter ATP-binding protein [Bacillus sp. J14TS2]|uniref:ABC transporter ATP-binding protein n=1 Tax=Bacillus sp. J14TS2 TaxID=2807188 RepID=UPI001B074599|nr:ABC transporter ATP-binding protein [Bacillus sp. J14TS2]GIN74802.1 ABC transporter ATP-binding protein [Bacillus sp. J14TS2]